jgi:hypothetical protein
MEVDAGFMLGVKRTLIDNADEFSVELTMSAYVDGMFTAFDEFDKPKHVKTPFPEHEHGHISREVETDESEVKAVLNRGYMRLVGMLLWASRNVFPECAYGTSILCSVMSCPSEKAWRAGMHMLVWLKQERLRGIKFTHGTPNDDPIALADSSYMHGVKRQGKLQRHDFKDQYGWVIMWQGGPVAWASKKHHHVGKSTCQVEYMALYHCSNNIIAFRQLLYELEYYDILSRPTSLFGDNTQANRLVQEDLISSGNQYIYLTYHALKESYRMKMLEVYMKKSKMNLSDLFTKNVDAGTTRNLLDPLCGYKVTEIIPDTPGKHRKF